ncbi:I78 family peptidase inhibitor [Chthonobacter rhizosphaerae]|uniref:I78 family peptidase inhibitor n=1 Tax=Chthonobacter rhizosphaerae TaxID=2735553 RepID=UPI0015EF1078|nr:I78 family peptidase inhibitor [Chthonobacter rhizosphaerae]
MPAGPIPTFGRRLRMLAAGGALAFAGCVAVPIDAPPPPGIGPGPIDSPGYGGPPPVYGGPGPGYRACRVERARFAIGEPATGRLIEAAARRSRASEVRVVRPGDFVTRDFREDRLTLETDRRGTVVAVSCG